MPRRLTLTRELPSNQSSIPTVDDTENLTTTRAEMNTKTHARPSAVAMMSHAAWFSSVTVEKGGEYPGGRAPIESELDMLAVESQTLRKSVDAVTFFDDRLTILDFATVRAVCRLDLRICTCTSLGERSMSAKMQGRTDNDVCYTVHCIS